MNHLFTSYLHMFTMRGFASLQNAAPDKNSAFWAVSEHFTLSIYTMQHLPNMFRQYQMGPPDSPGPLEAAYLTYWLSPPQITEFFFFYFFVSRQTYQKCAW